MAATATFKADKKGSPLEVVSFETGHKTPIFLLPVETFPGHRNNIYLVLLDGLETIIDVGSQWPTSHPELMKRFDELRDRFAVKISPSDIKRAIITHAHIDHFGDVEFFQRQGVEIWIHELDARVLSNFKERLIIASKDVNIFLRRAGVPLEERQRLTHMYSVSKDYFSSIPIDRRLRHGDQLPGGFQVYHVPGHCPGLIMLKLDDVLFTGDHVLARTTPIQTPQSITPFTGLENYLRSLEKTARIENIALGLGGHEAPIPDVYGRIAEIADHHRKRLNWFRNHTTKPATVKQLADAHFGKQKGYGRILAYTEAGAHVEYLHALGELAIANIDEAAEEGSVFKYQFRGA